MVGLTAAVKPQLNKKTWKVGPNELLPEGELTCRSLLPGEAAPLTKSQENQHFQRAWERFNKLNFYLSDNGFRLLTTRLWGLWGGRTERLEEWEVVDSIKDTVFSRNTGQMHKWTHKRDPYKPQRYKIPAQRGEGGHTIPQLHQENGESESISFKTTRPDRLTNHTAGLNSTQDQLTHTNWTWQEKDLAKRVISNLDGKRFEDGDAEENWICSKNNAWNA